MPRPHGVAQAAGLGTGDPLAFAGRGGDAPIQRGRELQGDQWLSLPDALMYADVRVSLSRGSMHAKVPNFAAGPRSIVTFQWQMVTGGIDGTRTGTNPAAAPARPGDREKEACG